VDQAHIHHLRKALNNLYDLHTLRQSPLCRMFVQSNPFDAAPRLQHILEDAIAALKPKPEASHYTSAWEIYELLSLRYLQQFSQKEVANQLGVSLSQMNRIQQKALETMAAYLWEKYPSEQFDQGRNEGTGGEAPGVSGQPENLGAHLEWLEAPPSEKSSCLEEQLADVLVLIQPFFNKYAVALEQSIPQKSTQVLVYPMALRQILLNLLTIATPLVAKGVIRLGIEQQVNWMVLELDGSTSTPVPAVLSEDMQINLAIASDLAGRSGGNLDFQLDDRGLRSTLHLPVHASLAVLAIDDSLDFLHLLERYLANTRYRLVTTSDPQQAVPLAESSAAKAILIDVMMPRVDGWVLLQRLQNHPVTTGIPVIICSILRQEELANSLGASAYLSKPVNQTELLALLDSLVQVAPPCAAPDAG
jgi:CheY-like chemotaxis protein